MMIESSKLCFVMDTEGSSPLEVAVGTVVNRVLMHALHAIVRPQLSPAAEAWASRNIHGISYDYARNVGLTFDKVVAITRKYLSDQREFHAADIVVMFVSGSISGGDAKVLDALNLDWLRVRSVVMDPWLARINQPYFKDIHHPCVRVCSIRAHHDYAPIELAMRAVSNATAKAKLAGGLHCATDDIVRLSNFLADTHVI